MWVVEAIGEETGGTFTYLVDAPENTKSIDVACAAYRQHGKLRSRDQVTELLGPDQVTYWQETVEWEAA